MGRGRSSINVEVIGRQQLTELHRALRRQADGKERVKDLRKQLTAAAKPLVPAIRGNIRSMPSHGENRRRGKKTLRSRLSRAVTLQVKFRGERAGVFVFMNPRKMPDHQKSLPGYFEVLPGKSRFRHPVFGNQDKWVQQFPPMRGYFTRSLDGVEARVQRNVEAVIERMAREIEG